MSMENKRERFHPSAVLVYFIRDIKHWVFLFVLFLVDIDSGRLYSILALSALILFLSAKSFIKYWTHTYTLSSDHITLYKGIFNKRETEITYERIQTVKQRQWFFFKPFNIIEVLIETASTSPGEAEASLTAVDESIIKTIESYRNQTSPDLDEEKEIEAADNQFSLKYQDVVLFGLTDLTAILIVFTALSFVFEWIPDRFFSELVSLVGNVRGILIVGLMFMGLLIIAALSLLKSFLLFYDYKAERHEDTLTISYGLFERKTQKIPLSKIQGIKVNKQLLRHLFNRSSVELVIMGGQESEGESLSIKNIYLFPLISNDQVYTRLNQFIPDRAIEKPEVKKVTQNRVWYFLRWKMLAGIPLVAIALYFNTTIGIIASMILSIILLMAWKKSQVQAYAIQKNRLLCIQQFEGFTTVQFFIMPQNVQALSYSTSIALVNKDIGHMDVTFKENEHPNNYGLRYIKEKDSRRIHEAFWETLERETDYVGFN